MTIPKKALMFILPTNGGEAGVIIAAILLGLSLPITPVQILWVNMITAVTLALALAFESPEADVMQLSPRDPREPLLSGFLLWRMTFVSLLLVGGVIGLFLWETARGASLEASRTAAINALVMGEIFYLFNSRYLVASVLSPQGLLGNRVVLLAVAVLLPLQLLFTYLPLLQHWFGTTGLDGAAWGRIFLFGAAVFVLVELEKGLWRRMKSADTDRSVIT